MRFAECECKNCGLHYLIRIENGTLADIHCCIKCSSSNVRFHKIDRSRFEEEING